MNLRDELQKCDHCHEVRGNIVVNGRTIPITCACNVENCPDCGERIYRHRIICNFVRRGAQIERVLYPCRLQHRCDPYKRALKRVRSGKPVSEDNDTEQGKLRLPSDPLTHEQRVRIEWYGRCGREHRPDPAQRIYPYTSAACAASHHRDCLQILESHRVYCKCVCFCHNEYLGFCGHVWRASRLSENNDRLEAAIPATDRVQ